MITYIADMLSPLGKRAFTVLALLCLLALSLPSQAAGGKALSSHAYKQLTRVQQQMEQGDYNDALAALNSMLGNGGQSGYEEAVVQQMLGYVQIGREAYPAAITAFERSLALQQLPEATGAAHALQPRPALPGTGPGGQGHHDP